MKGAVLTLGALAAAVAAVIALVPKSHSVSTVAANLSQITVDPNTSLVEYDARYATVPVRAGRFAAFLSQRDWRYRLVDSTTSITGSAPTSTSIQTPATPPPGSTSTTTTGGTSTTTGGTSTMTTGSTSTTTSQQGTTSTLTTQTHRFERAIQAIHNIPPSEIIAVARGVATNPVPVNVGNTLLAVVVNLGFKATCGTRPDPQHCPAVPQIEHELQRGVSPEVAALQVARIFASSRSKIINHELDPVGATVHFHLQLIGFQSKVATLIWSLYPAHATQPLPEEWWTNVIVKQFKADVPNDSFDSQFWMPEPRTGGPYIVDLTVVDNQGIARAEARSNSFT